MVKIIKNRDKRMMDAAIELAEEDSYQWITREAVAERAGVAPATISFHFRTMAELKRAVLREAISRRSLKIIAEGIGARHRIIMEECPEDLRAEALSSLMSA